MKKIFCITCILLTCLTPRICLSQKAEEEKEKRPDIRSIERTASPPYCPDNTPHPGSIDVYVNGKMRVIPYEEYPSPFRESGGYFEGKECVRMNHVVKSYEIYADADGNLVDKEAACSVFIKGFDINEELLFIACGSCPKKSN